MQVPTDDEPWAWAVFSEHGDVPCDDGTCDYSILYDPIEAQTACDDMNESHVDEGKEPGARVVPLVPFALVEQARADLAASQREVERLRHGEATAEDGVCPDAVEVVQLRAEVERCRAIIAAIMEGDFADGEGGHQDATFNTDYREGVDALRYLASIGRVEIVSEQGRRVVARWVK